MDRFKGFHELPMGNTDSIDLIIKVGGAAMRLLHDNVCGQICYGMYVSLAAGQLLFRTLMSKLGLSSVSRS